METPRDDEIEFDFFDDEPATTEAPPSRVRLPRRGGGGGSRRVVRPPHGLTPLLRLLGLVLFVIAIVLILVLLIQSCAAESKHDTYANYMCTGSGFSHVHQGEPGSFGSFNAWSCMTHSVSLRRSPAREIG